jgi:general secretion pathway protein M
MSRSLLTGRTGQLLALGLTLSAPALLGLGVVVPLIEWHGERAEALAQRTALARRMQALAAALPELREQAAVIAASKAGEAALLAGDSDSMASASLQERLQAMFAQAGVQLNSVETLPGEEAGAYRRIRLRVSFNVAWPALMALLKEIHVATPALLVDELQVQPALRRINAAPGTFDVSCAIFAFRSGALQVSASRAGVPQALIPQVTVQ